MPRRKVHAEVGGKLVVLSRVVAKSWSSEACWWCVVGTRWHVSPWWLDPSRIREGVHKDIGGIVSGRCLSSGDRDVSVMLIDVWFRSVDGQSVLMS